MTSERQLGLLWGGVAALLVVVSPIADRIAAALPACPFKILVGLPCLACGSTRAGVALSRFDLAGAVFVNPLAAAGWVVLVGGGLVAGALAFCGVPVREPQWRLALPMRWFLAMVLLTNWVYLVGAGT